MKGFIFSIFISISLSTFAATIVTDLDDTLKITNVEDKVWRVYNALFRKDAFLGMPKLMQSMNQQDHKLFILSASPNMISFRIKKFLEHNSINIQGLFTRKLSELGQKRQYKLRGLERVIDKSTDELVLIGDNVELDEEVYLETQENHPNKIAKIYIHKIKDQETLSEQSVPFFTAFEIAFEEFLANRLSLEQVRTIGLGLIKQIDYSKIIPHFAHCPTNENEFIQRRLPFQLQSIYKVIKFRIVSYCQNRKPKQD